MVEIKKCQKLSPVKYSPNPKFGTVFAPHMLKIDYKTTDQPGHVWRAEIVPYGGETYTPSTIALHYGQCIFEGLKAYRQVDGSVAIFRPDLHTKRFTKSAQRLAIPSIDEDVFMKCLTEYVAFEQESVPNEPEHSLYLRPLLLGRDEIVKVGRSQKYSFYILSCVVGSYFQGGQSKPAKVFVNRQFVRAFPGGLGEAKTAANYAASLAAQAYAETFHCDQVLYLDGITHDLVDELGGMNFFAVKNRILITPPLTTGTILDGVTRRSILEIAKSLGFTGVEEQISFTQLIKDIKSGVVTEAFACGTAAIVHSIGEFLVQESHESTPQSVILPEATPVAKTLLETLQKIQRGTTPAPGDWLKRI